MKRVAVVLFNLGGPDSPEAVRPFLFNLFNDRAIIDAPQPIRYLLAKFISLRRAPVAREIYGYLGGSSPLLPNTLAQLSALEGKLAAHVSDEFRCFPAMRYWHPMTAETVEAVKSWNPDKIILLPLYPQFSTTTSGSSIAAWKQASRSSGLSAPVTAVCCYRAEAGFVEAVANRIREAVPSGSSLSGYRILFSAHGLPKKIVEGGDPYQWQVEQSVAAVVDRLSVSTGAIDHAVSYQSRVGPLEWIGPDLEVELSRAASDGRNVMIVPIAFVSEHSETLVELDIEYRKVAGELGIANFVRVRTVDADESFIEELAHQVMKAAESDAAILSGGGAGNGSSCPVEFGKCALVEVGNR